LISLMIIYRKINLHVQQCNTVLFKKTAVGLVVVLLDNPLGKVCGAWKGPFVPAGRVVVVRALVACGGCLE
jgi:hypothetical protein